MSDLSYPRWIRLLDDATGVFVIIVAIAAFLELAYDSVFALEILSIGLFLTGVVWVIWGIYIIKTNRYARIFMVTTGLFTVGLSLVDFILFTLPPNFLIVFPAAGLILVSLSRIVLGIVIGDIEVWIQMLQVLAGILTINLAAFVFIFPNVGFDALLIFLVISMIANGLVRLIVGRTDVVNKCMECVDE
ncbi:MAG: hypothetical protein ACFFEV_10200 [Candidatus Thorarchaeota archaeon]